MQIVDEFAVFAVFTGEDVAKLEDRGVEGDGAVTLEDGGDGIEDAVAEDHVGSRPVASTFGGFELEGRFVLVFVFRHCGVVRSGCWGNFCVVVSPQLVGIKDSDDGRQPFELSQSESCGG